MKALIPALLLGVAPCQERTETLLVGLMCPTIEGAHIVANTPVSYMFAEHVERAGCMIVATSGRVVAESPPFGIGNELFSFETIQTPDGPLYRLKSLGPGHLA